MSFENCNEFNNAWKKVAIYIGGTFNDMHAERDYLLKEVFPELQTLCGYRKIHITPVDLRGEVPEERECINFCLQKIDECRPFFIFFLGQNRGEVPDFEHDISEETFRRYVNLMDYEGMSTTEIEIEHALNPLIIFRNENVYHCPPARHCLFFFRDDSYIDDITDYQRLIYTNDSEGNKDIIRISDERLEETKNMILQRKKFEDYKSDDDETKTNIIVTDYEGTWDSKVVLHELSHYENGESEGRLTDFKCGDRSLKEVLIEQLIKQLDKEFPDMFSGIVKPQVHVVGKTPDNSYIYLSYDNTDLRFIDSQIQLFEIMGINFKHQSDSSIKYSSLLTVFISKDSFDSLRIKSDVIDAISNDVGILLIYLDDMEPDFGETFNAEYESKFKNSIKYSIHKYELDELGYIDKCNEIFQLFGVKK